MDDEKDKSKGPQKYSSSITISNQHQSSILASKIID
jgi:hypothetical protein